TVFLALRRSSSSPPFPYTTLFRSIVFPTQALEQPGGLGIGEGQHAQPLLEPPGRVAGRQAGARALPEFTHQRQQLLPGQGRVPRSEEHTSELQSRENLVCRLLLEK